MLQFAIYFHFSLYFILDSEVSAMNSAARSLSVALGISESSAEAQLREWGFTVVEEEGDALLVPPAPNVQSSVSPQSRERLEGILCAISKPRRDQTMRSGPLRVPGCPSAGDISLTDRMLSESIQKSSLPADERLTDLAQQSEMRKRCACPVEGGSCEHSTQTPSSSNRQANRATEGQKSGDSRGSSSNKIAAENGVSERHNTNTYGLQCVTTVHTVHTLVTTGVTTRSGVTIGRDPTTAKRLQRSTKGWLGLQ
eukprot:GDKH01012839.1.p1 GENE.GDKH01012839.1~~GDKH01012839.1.p1  ORF type:complete len:254 (+),score=-2.92 GDKH01012839.1:117-878(+)